MKRSTRIPRMMAPIIKNNVPILDLDFAFILAAGAPAPHFDACFLHAQFPPVHVKPPESCLRRFRGDRRIGRIVPVAAEGAHVVGFDIDQFPCHRLSSSSVFTMYLSKKVYFPARI